VSNLSDHVSLTITADSVGIARAGFGVPLITSYSANWAERVRFYTDQDGVAADFPDTTSPEYRAAEAMFAQTPHPEQIAIGRCALKPTQVYVIGVNSVTNSHDYKVDVQGQFTGGGVATTVTASSDGTATNDEIIDALVTALNAVPSKNYTAAATGTGGSHVCTVTGNSAANWFSLAVWNVADLSISQTHSDPGIATDLDAIELDQPGWYCLHTTFNSSGVVRAAAAWIEGHIKIYIPATNDSAACTAVTTGTADTLDYLHASNYMRTAGMYHPSPADFAGAAWMGRVLPIDPGGDDLKWKSLAGVTAAKLTATHRTNLRAKMGNTIETVAGDNITWEGTMASGRFIDLTRSIDWLYDDMQKGVFGVLVSVEKVPFTDGGIALVENEVRASLGRAISNGILADDPAPVVTAPRARDVSSSNKALRLLPDIKFSATFAGSVHKVKITGNISV